MSACSLLLLYSDGQQAPELEVQKTALAVMLLAVQADPDMRQAKALLEHLETTIAKEALIGVGIGATGLLGIGALVVGALLSRR